MFSTVCRFVCSTDNFHISQFALKVILNATHTLGETDTCLQPTFFIFVSLLQLPFCTISLFIFYGKPCLLNFSMLRVSCFCLNVCHQCHFLSVKCNMFGTYCISEKVALVFWIIVDIIRSCLTFLPYCPVYECVTFRSLATTIALKRTTELSTRYIMYYLDVTRLK